MNEAKNKDFQRAFARVSHRAVKLRRHSTSLPSLKSQHAATVCLLGTCQIVLSLRRVSLFCPFLHILLHLFRHLHGLILRGSPLQVCCVIVQPCHAGLSTSEHSVDLTSSFPATFTSFWILAMPFA